MNQCRIHPAGPTPDRSLIERLMALPTSIISDSQHRVGGGSGIMPIIPFVSEGRVAGPALTVRTRGGDNLAVHQALRSLQRGQILAVDAGGHLDRAIVGEIMLRQAKAIGAAAVIVDGVVRDRDGIAALGLPVLARGICHLGPYKSGPGEIHGVIALGGVVVRDGDILVADNDGFVAVAADRAETVATIGEGRAEDEVALLAAASRGELDMTWLDSALDIEWAGRGDKEQEG